MARGGPRPFATVERFSVEQVDGFVLVDLVLRETRPSGGLPKQHVHVELPPHLAKNLGEALLDETTGSGR